MIVAAGMSSRMGDFKPMLNIGSISIAQRIIATLKQAGASLVVVVTGFNAEELERHLARSGVVFLRNESFRTTQMFDSARIGLEYLSDKCRRILFTPVDIPLFTAETVRRLLETDADLACPYCGGERGHPILMSSSLAARLLDDSGEGGLQGALGRSGAAETRVEVEDEGILRDADTPSDYRALLDYHNRQLVRPVVRLELASERPFFDSRIAMLLYLVDETHSVRAACQRMQLSYSSGWNTINAVEKQLSRGVITRSQGGAGGGSSVLTDYGRELLRRYELFEADVEAETRRLFEERFADLIWSK